MKIENIEQFCLENRIELDIRPGTEGSMEDRYYNYLAKMKSEDGKEEFEMCTVTEKKPLIYVPHHCGGRDYPCDTLVTFPGKASIYAMGGHWHIEKGYVFSKGNLQGSGQVCIVNGQHIHLEESYNQPLTDEVLKKYEPVIALLEQLTGRTLIQREK